MMVAGTGRRHWQEPPEADGMAGEDLMTGGAVHGADPSARPLEVSAKNREVLGRMLSAFNLKLDGCALENVFQSGKVFEHGGPYPDLLDVPPKEAKRDGRLKSSGALTAFRYQGRDFPLTVFYDYIYYSAVRESLGRDEIRAILEYDHFTNIGFNPARSVNTQAKRAAMLRLTLEEHGCLPDLPAEEFIRYHREHIAC